RAGFDPEFQRQVEAGEVTVADSAAFELGRSLAAAEADGNLFNERLGALMRPNMTDEEFEEAFNQVHQEIASSRDPSDHVYHGELSQAASRAREHYALWLAGQRRQAAEDDAKIQFGRVASQRLTDAITGGMDAEQLVEELQAIDRDAMTTGLSVSDRAKILADAIENLMEITGDRYLANLGAHIELSAGVEPDGTVKSAGTLDHLTMNRLLLT